MGASAKLESARGLGDNSGLAVIMFIALIPTNPAIVTTIQ